MTDFKTLFKREDGTGYVAVYLGRDAEALARGNGYNSSSPSDVLARNTVAHGATSAKIAYDHGYETAEKVGDYKEGRNPNSYGPGDEDKFADQYNNEVGRRIGEYARANDLSEDDIDDLIMDALNNDDFIINRDDPRVDLDGGDPKTDPDWNGPSEGWQGTAADRDYSNVDEPAEDPIGYLDKLAEAMGGLLPGAIPPPQMILDIGLAFLSATLKISPLVLDLDHSGTIELISVTNSDTYWDGNNDGMANVSGWVTGGGGSRTDGFIP